MLVLPGYSVLDCLYEGPSTVLFRAVRDQDGLPVVLKTLRAPRPSPSHVARLRHEYEVTRDLDSDGVVRVLAFVTTAERPILVLEDFGGTSLDRLLGQPMSIGTFLVLAVQTAAALADVHARGVVHRDIKPHNLIVRIDTGAVRIADFGLASRLPREHLAPQPPSRIEGTLAYIAPEQTGRMNRSVDGRADLYSLGVTFYQALTGVLPFEARDALGWVHAQIAQPPRPPVEIRAEIPQVVSDVVMRLLAKMTDDRYQTASGLQRDLERCRDDWLATRDVAPFPLAAHDVPDQLRIPQKLYGREADVDALMEAFGRVLSRETVELVMVCGYAGVGKSTLIHELHRPIARAHGTFVSGKFDQYQRGIPYATLAQALRELMRQVLAGTDDEVAAWARRIVAAVGVHGRLITDLVPELELVIGSQPEVQELPLSEAQHRFHMVFRRLLGVFSHPDHPLVIFLDDLQWIDGASLALIEHLVTHADTRCLLLIGAYRDNEVRPTHPLVQMLDAVKRDGAMVQTLVLSPLSPEHVSQMCADTFHCDVAAASPLAALIHEKTGGNPFFVIQLLMALYDDGLVAFDRRAGAWCWDLRRIRVVGYTDNVVELMLGKLKRLPDAVQHVLQLAACLGTRVDRQTLASVAACSPETLDALLWPVLEAVLMLREDQHFVFLHDRVQQAAYQLVPEAERPAVHLAIGRCLWAQTPEAALDDAVFDLVGQLDRGAALLSEPGERRDLAALNLRAGRKAKVSAAYQPALDYLVSGLALLPPDRWESDYELSYGLCIELARCEWLTGDFAAAERLVDEILEHARTPHEAAAAFGVKIDVAATRDQHARAVELGLACLDRLGLPLQAHPTWADVEREYARIWELLGTRTIESLIDLPPMAEPAVIAAVDVLNTINASALFTDLNLYYLLSCRMVTLSIEHGNTDSSGAGYALLGYLPGPAFGRYDEGYRFAKLGYDLVETRRLIGQKARVLVDFTIVSSWTHPFATRRDLMERARVAAVEAGDLTYACYACMLLGSYQIARGVPVSDAIGETERLFAITRGANFAQISMITVAQRQFLQRLRGLTDPGFDQEAFERELRANAESLVLAACWYDVYQLQLHYLFGDYDAALASAAKAKTRRRVSLCFPEEAEYRYFEALALAACDAEPATIDAHREQFRIWAASCPDNFDDGHALLSAEVARLRGQALEAERWYEQALSAARKAGFIHHEAITYECAAAFYRRRGFAGFAELYLREARACYQRWGALAKVRQLDQRYPSELIQKPTSATATFAVSVERLDAMSVIKASQAISSQLVLPELLVTLMRIVIEHIGAQAGYLVLSRGGALSIAAEAHVESPDVQVLQPPPAVDATVLPLSILQYVSRTREPVILADAGDLQRFDSDRYLADRRPASVLCVPIVRQQTLVGMIYLENNLVRGAFTPDKLAVLDFLISQAGISLENATLFAELQQENVERRQAEAALQTSQEQLRAIVDNSTAVIFVKDREGRYLLVNRRYETLFHISGSEIAGKTDYELFPAARADVFWANDRAVLESGHALEVEEVVPQDDGLHTYISLKVPLLAADGTAYAVCGIATDITERAHAAEALQEAVRVRDEFLSVASHELRGPLTALQYAVEGMREVVHDSDAAPAFVDKALASALRQTQRLTRLINSLLDVARIHGGQLELDREPVELVTLVSGAIEQFRDELERTQTKVTLLADTLVVGPWDRMRLEQVIVNLLSNAIKFGVGKPIEVAVSAVDGTARVAITDHGIGISAEQQAKLFGRFERGVSSRHYGGLGLGLYIVRQIVDAHGGSVHVHSRPGDGARFIVELPDAASGHSDSSPRFSVG